jgi:Uncharacterized protein with an alpha/beta hydrolase fold
MLQGFLKRKQVTSKNQPAIFIPGSSAGVNRFDILFKKLGIPIKQVLKIFVNKDGSLSISGNYQGFVVVGFENNKDGYKNIKAQAEYLDKAMMFLTANYKFKNFNAIGHSNGGLNWTIFLEQYFSKYNKKISNLITLGSPFNLSKKSSEKTSMLKDMIANKEKIPSDLIMYSLMGLDDKLVPKESAWSARYIYQNQAKDYTEINLSGLSSNHSALVQNKYTVRLLKDVLNLSRKSS